MSSLAVESHSYDTLDAMLAASRSETPGLMQAHEATACGPDGHKLLTICNAVSSC